MQGEFTITTGSEWTVEEAVEGIVPSDHHWVLVGEEDFGSCVTYHILVEPPL